MSFLSLHIRYNRLQGIRADNILLPFPNFDVWKYLLKNNIFIGSLRVPHNFMLLSFSQLLPDPNATFLPTQPASSFFLFFSLFLCLLVSVSHSLPSSHFMLPKYCWIWDLVWGVVSLPEATPLRKTDCPLLSSYKMPIAPLLGVGFLFPSPIILHGDIWSDLRLHRSCAITFTVSFMFIFPVCVCFLVGAITSGS